MCSSLLRKHFSTSRKVFKNASDAIYDMKRGNSIVFGGFGLCGIPEKLIKAIKERKDLTDLEALSDSAGVADFGLGLLMQEKKIKRIMASFIGENKLF